MVYGSGLKSHLGIPMIPSRPMTHVALTPEREPLRDMEAGGSAPLLVAINTSIGDRFGRSL